MLPRTLSLRAILLLLAAAVAAAGGGTALGLRLSSARPVSIDVVATRPVAETAALGVSDIALLGNGGVALAGASPSVAQAPQLTDVGVVSVPPGTYEGVRATVNGTRLVARTPLVVRGALTPIVLVVRHGSLAAAAGNADVDHAVLVAAGQLIHPPDVAFVDQTGRSVPLRSLRGRVLVVAALDTHCHDTCPLYTAIWADLQRVIRERGWQDRVAIAEVSMDPARDTPGELAAYARMMGSDWPLLRSDPVSTTRFWLSLGASAEKQPPDDPAPVDWYTGKPETYHLHHSSLAAVFDQNGDARYLLQGNPGLGHALSAPLAALLGGEQKAQALEKLQSWTLTDLLDRVDVVLGAPVEKERGTEQRARLGSRAPEFGLLDLDGRRVQLHDQLGRATVVTFWATWCQPCRRDMPLLAAAVRAHPELTVLAVDEGESSGQVRDYLRSLLGADASRITALLDGDKSVGGRYGVGGLPVTVFVGADGIVQLVATGQLSAQTLATGLARSGA